MAISNLMYHLFVIRTLCVVLRLKKKKKRFAIDCCRKHDSKSQVNDWIQAL